MPDLTPAPIELVAALSFPVRLERIIVLAARKQTALACLYTFLARFLYWVAVPWRGYDDDSDRAWIWVRPFVSLMYREQARAQRWALAGVLVRGIRVDGTDLMLDDVGMAAGADCFSPLAYDSRLMAPVGMRVSVLLSSAVPKHVEVVALVQHADGMRFAVSLG